QSSYRCLIPGVPDAGTDNRKFRHTEVAERIRVMIEPFALINDRGALPIAKLLEPFDEPLTARVDKEPPVPSGVTEERIHGVYPIHHDIGLIRNHDPKPRSFEDAQVCLPDRGRSLARFAGRIRTDGDRPPRIAPLQFLSHFLGVAAKSRDFIEDVKLL